MDLMNWIWAAVALGSGLLIGELAGRLTRSALARATDRPLLAASSRTIGKAVFWCSVMVGLIVAAGLIDPGTLEEFGARLRSEVPSLLLAGVWLIVGYAMSVALATMVGQSALKATGVRQVPMERALRITIMAAAVAAALHQAGVSQAIVLVVVAVGLATPALTIGILTALGARSVASQLAAGRVLRHHLRVGDTITSLGYSGRVVALHATAVELSGPDGASVLLPYSQLLELGLEVSERRGAYQGHL